MRQGVQEKLQKMVNPNYKPCRDPRGTGRSSRASETVHSAAWAERGWRPIGTIVNTLISLSAADYSTTDTVSPTNGATGKVRRGPQDLRKMKRTSPADTRDCNLILCDKLVSCPKMKSGTLRSTTNKTDISNSFRANRGPPGRRFPAGLSKPGCAQGQLRKSF